MDTATNLAKDNYYLDNNLRKVIRAWPVQGTEIMGLGVGLDLSPYYDRCFAVDLVDGVSNHLFFDILEVLRGYHRR